MEIISAVNDFGGGYAWLGGSEPLPVDVGIVVKRESEKNCFLGPEGWQSTPCELTAHVNSRNGRLLLGPSICDRLKEGDLVTFTIRGISSECYWPAVPLSGRKATGKGFVASNPEAKKSSSPQDSQPAKRQDSPTAGLQLPGSNGHEAVGVGGGQQPGNSPVSRGFLASRFFLGAIAVLLLAALGASLWFFAPREWLDHLETAISDTAGQVADLPVRVMDAVMPGGPVRDTAYWTGVMQDPASTPAQLYGFAIETREDPAMTSVSHELLFQAAQRGDMTAQRDYSRLYDPTVNEISGWIAAKNARTALEIYARMKQAGEASVDADIRRVCTFLQPKIYTNAESRTAFEDYCS